MSSSDSSEEEYLPPQKLKRNGGLNKRVKKLSDETPKRKSVKTVPRTLCTPSVKVVPLPGEPDSFDILPFAQKLNPTLEPEIDTDEPPPVLPSVQLFPSSEVSPIKLVQPCSSSSSVSVISPIPYVSLETRKFEYEDVGTRVISARLSIPQCSSKIVVQWRKEGKLMILSTQEDNLPSSVTERIDWFHVLRFTYENKLVKEYASYAYHVPRNTGSTYVLSTICVVCQLCLNAGNYPFSRISIRRDSASNIYRHFRKYHSSVEGVRQLLPHADKLETTKCTPTAAYATPLTRKECVEIVANILVSKLLSFAVVECDIFRESLRRLNAAYVNVGRREVANYVISEANSYSEIVKKKLETEVSACAVISDLWTSKGGQGVLAVAIAFVNADLEMEYIFLGLKRVRGKHTGASVAAHITELLTEFGVHKKRVFSVTDAGGNMLAAMRFIQQHERLQGGCISDEDSDDSEENGPEDISDTGYLDEDASREETITVPVVSNRYEVTMQTQFRCVVHGLQLCMSKAVSLPGNQMITQAMNYARDIITCIRGSTSVREELHDLTKKQLLLPGTTRWNSWLDALVRLTEVITFKGAYAILSAKHKSATPAAKKKLCRIPEVYDFELFQRILRLFAPFGIATDMLQGDGILVYEILPQLANIYYRLKSVPECEGSVVGDFRDSLINELIRRFKTCFTAEVYVAAVLFAPKYRGFFKLLHKQFPDNPFEAPTEEEAISILRSILPPDITSSSDKSSSSSQETLFGCDDDAGSVLDDYLQMSVWKKMDIGVFWRQHEERFKQLIPFVRFVLSVPASTARVERYFSTAGLICSNLRNRLQVSTLNAIMRYRMDKLRASYTLRSVAHKPVVPQVFLATIERGLACYKPLPIITDAELLEYYTAYAAAETESAI